MIVQHSADICYGDSDEEWDVSSDEEEESFKKEHFNKKTGDKLSISFDGSWLEIVKVKEELISDAKHDTVTL